MSWSQREAVRHLTSSLSFDPLSVVTSPASLRVHIPLLAILNWCRTTSPSKLQAVRHLTSSLSFDPLSVATSPADLCTFESQFFATSAERKRLEEIKGKDKGRNKK
ncbi:8820_t:CDS:2, partial [Acaulospora morrowiae]